MFFYSIASRREEKKKEKEKTTGAYKVEVGGRWGGWCGERSVLVRREMSIPKSKCTKVFVSCCTASAIIVGV